MPALGTYLLQGEKGVGGGGCPLFCSPEWPSALVLGATPLDLSSIPPRLLAFRRRGGTVSTMRMCL